MAFPQPPSVQSSTATPHFPQQRRSFLLFSASKGRICVNKRVGRAAEHVSILFSEFSKNVFLPRGGQSSRSG